MPTRYLLIDKRDNRTRSVFDKKPTDYDKTFFKIQKIKITPVEDKQIKMGYKKAVYKRKLKLIDF